MLDHASQSVASTCGTAMRPQPGRIDSSICLALTAVALLLHRLAVWATFKHTKQVLFDRDQSASPWPALSVLKPIKGDEEELEQNLISFFEQVYPGPLQLVFASTEPGDP